MTLATLLLAAAAAGQNPSPTGNLYGTALDEQGKFLPGVRVALTGPGAVQTATTDARGDFRFLNLSPGDYVVALERTGFETVRREVTVALGKNAVLAITMPVAGAAEAVTVSGEPTMDSRRTETGATFDRKELDTIPTTRDPWAILRQVPGVLLGNMNVSGSESAAQSIFVGKGSHFDQNTYNLDGVAITDMAATGSTPLYFDFDSLQDIEVVTGGSDPSLATPGVSLNLVTKRGTNDLRGSARAFQSGAGWDYGVEAGGPLWKDRLWLWGAGARNDVPGQTFFLSTGEPVRQKTDLEHWNAKVNAQLARANSLTLFYLHFDKVADGKLAGPDHSPESTWKQTTPTAAYKVEDSQVLSEKLFAFIYFSYLGGTFTLAPEGGLDKQADIYDDSVWHNSYLYYRTRHPQHQAGVTSSGFFDTGDLRHELKFGFGYKHTMTESLSAWPGDQIVGDAPDGLAWLTRDASVKYEMNYYDAYFGDTIQTRNLTVNVGLRFDYQQARNHASAVPANPVFPELLPAVAYGGDSGYPITWRLLQPRVGATYTLGSDRKTLLRASYSRFANQLGSEIFSINAFPGPAYIYYGWQDTNGNHLVDKGEVDLSDFEGFLSVDPNNPASSVPVNRIARNLKPPNADEFIVGAERQVFADLSASIAYTHRSFRDPEFQPAIGVTRADYQHLGNASGTATDVGTGFTLSFNEPYYGLTANPPPTGFEIRNRPDYRETYDGVELQVVKRLSHRWMLRASFAYNDWKKQVGPGAIVDPNNLLGGSNASGAVVEPVGNGFGSHAWVFINSKWQFNVNGVVQLPLGIGAAANFFGRQGFVRPYFIRVVTHDTTGSRPRIQIGEVDAYRNPDVYQLDLHVERLFRIASKVTATPSLDCFNVVNSHTVLQRVGLVGTYSAERDQAFSQSDTFNKAAEVLGNRALRGGVRISF
jgi:hypothetical protein